MGYYDNLNLGEDMMVMYGLETGTLKIEGSADATLTKCILDEPIDTREMEPTAGQVIRMDTLKIWPASKSAKPPLGSVLVDDQGTYWTILAVRFKGQVKSWECHCRNLSILPSDYNKAVVLRAVFSKGRANESKATWHGLFSGQTPPTTADVVAARFQPAGTEAMIRFSSEWSKESFMVYFDKPLSIDFAGGEYRLVDANNGRYRILRYWDEQRIDTFACCTAVRIIEGVEYAGQPSPLPMPSFPTA